MRQRLIVAALAGLLCFVLCYLQLRATHAQALDFTWAWRGIRVLMSGANPYHDPALAPQNPYPFQDPLFYPMPALMVALPFAWLAPYWAGAFFAAGSATLLTFLITRDGYWRLPMLLSVPFVNAMASTQWSPLITAAAFGPFLLPFALPKISLGLPILLSYGSRRGYIACGVVFLASLLLLPTWPLDWYGNLSRHRDLTPLLVFPGWLLILAALHWRVREARLLLFMSVIPQIFYYDPLALWLIPRTFRQMLVLTLVSWLAPLVASYFPFRLSASIGVTFIYLPALAILLYSQRGKTGVETPA